jgi:hypothetical protein
VVDILGGFILFLGLIGGGLTYYYNWNIPGIGRLRD